VTCRVSCQPVVLGGLDGTTFKFHIYQIQILSKRHRSCPRGQRRYNWRPGAAENHRFKEVTGSIQELMYTARVQRRKFLTFSPVPRWFSAEFSRRFSCTSRVQCGILTDAPCCPQYPSLKIRTDVQNTVAVSPGLCVESVTEVLRGRFDPILGSARTVQTAVAVPSRFRRVSARTRRWIIRGGQCGSVAENQ
jgi:hypothetical protein